LLLARVGAVLVVAVLAALVVIGQPSPQARLSVAVTQPSFSAPASPSLPWDLDADIGSVMVFSWRGAISWEEARPYLVRDQVGGVLLFTANFGGYPADLKFWTDRVQQLASSECFGHPILVMLDEEGGRVSNVKADFAPPSPREMALGGPDHVRDLERANGAGLAAVGVGLNLAPVADVRTNSRDAVIGDRSFGASPAVVAPSVAAAVEGLHEGGVGATVKHFPGLGGAAGDPHVAIPTDPESEAQWRAVQLPGFQAGVNAGADAVMVTAVYTPGLGSGSTPALFSPSIIGRLRNELGFRGVIVSDSLSMWGIGQKWSLSEAAVMALAAGNDMLLLGAPYPSDESAAVAAVRAAVLSGRLDRTRLHESALRVNALRDRWGRSPEPCRSPAKT
jgi:beta-N-acetylhexosaminidase